MYLVEIPLQQELFENTDKFGEGREGLFVHLDQLNGPESVGHVEADVHPHSRDLVRQLDNGDTSLVQNLQSYKRTQYSSYSFSFICLIRQIMR